VKGGMMSIRNDQIKYLKDRYEYWNDIVNEYEQQAQSLEYTIKKAKRNIVKIESNLNYLKENNSE
jgi:septal ring factor EnvC (AmiA/AmiB activator)